MRTVTNAVEISLGNSQPQSQRVVKHVYCAHSTCVVHFFILKILPSWSKSNCFQCWCHALSVGFQGLSHSQGTVLASCFEGPSVKPCLPAEQLGCNSCNALISPHNSPFVRRLGTSVVLHCQPSSLSQRYSQHSSYSSRSEPLAVNSSKHQQMQL